MVAGNHRPSADPPRRGRAGRPRPGRVETLRRAPPPRGPGVHTGTRRPRREVTPPSPACSFCARPFSALLSWTRPSWTWPRPARSSATSPFRTRPPRSHARNLVALPAEPAVSAVPATRAHPAVPGSGCPPLPQRRNAHGPTPRAGPHVPRVAPAVPGTRRPGRVTGRRSATTRDPPCARELRLFRWPLPSRASSLDHSSYGALPPAPRTRNPLRTAAPLARGSALR